MADERICPVMTPQFRKVGELAVLDQPKTCIREKCAWWVESPELAFEGCAIVATAVYSIWAYNDDV